MSIRLKMYVYTNTFSTLLTMAYTLFMLCTPVFMKYNFPFLRYYRINFYFMEYDFPFPKYHRSNFYFMKNDFPFPRYHRSNFYFMKNDFPFPRYQKEIISCKRKITLHEIEIASWIPWKRKIILHE